MSVRDRIVDGVSIALRRAMFLPQKAQQVNTPKDTGPGAILPLMYGSFPQSTKATGSLKTESELFASYVSWTYICVSKVAKAIAMLPLNLYAYKSTTTGKFIHGAQIKRALYSEQIPRSNKIEVRRFLKSAQMERVQLYDHPFLDLLQKPNAGMVRFSLWYHIILRLELLGYCGVYLPKGRLGIPASIWPLPLTNTGVLEGKPDRTSFIKYWQYRDGDTFMQIPPEELLFINYPDPKAPWSGKSPVEAQAFPYDIYQYMLDQQNAIYENKAVFGNVFTTDSRLTDTQITQLKNQIASQYAGVARAGLPLVVHSGLKLDKNLAQSASDLMLAEVSGMTRDALIATHDLTPGKVGLVKDVNRSTIETLDRTFYQECIKPKSMLIEEYFEQFVLPMYDERLTMDFDLPDTEDKNLQMLERDSRLEHYVTTINEERSKLGMEAVSWGESPFIPFTSMQWSAKPKTPTATPVSQASTSSSEIKAFWTEERKVAYWEQFKVQTESWEKLFVDLMQDTFARQKREVLKALEHGYHKFVGEVAGWSRQKVRQHVKAKQSTKPFNIDKKKEAAILRNESEAVFQKILDLAGDARVSSLGRTKLAASIGFNVNDPKVKQWLGDRLDEFSNEVTGATFDEIDAILREGFQEGVGITELTDRLSEKFASYDQYRAQMIARTETIASSNFADVDAVRQMGLDEVLDKHWLSSRDDSARETHLVADMPYGEGNGIPVDASFVVGEDSMIAPGNGNIAAENINCRCTVYYTQREAE
jgi:phage portal protein BeeE